MKLTIKVQPHEDDSTRMGSCCPVAQALRLAVGLERCTLKTGSRFEAFAGAGYLTAIGPEGTILMSTPGEVSDWIRLWDETGEGEPISFEAETVSDPHPSNDKILGW